MELLPFGEEELGSRERFDEMHEPMAVCATPWRGLRDGSHFGGRGLIEPGAAERQCPGAHTIREPAEVADTRKTSRQDMLHEAT